MQLQWLVKTEFDKTETRIVKTPTQLQRNLKPTIVGGWTQKKFRKKKKKKSAKMNNLGRKFQKTFVWFSLTTLSIKRYQFPNLTDSISKRTHIYYHCSYVEFLLQQK